MYDNRIYVHAYPHTYVHAYYYTGLMDNIETGRAVSIKKSRLMVAELE